MAGVCVRPQSHCLRVCIVSFNGLMHFAVRGLWFSPDNTCASKH